MAHLFNRGIRQIQGLPKTSSSGTRHRTKAALNISLLWNIKPQSTMYPAHCLFYQMLLYCRTNACIWAELNRHEGTTIAKSNDIQSDEFDRRANRQLSWWRKAARARMLQSESAQSINAWSITLYHKGMKKDSNALSSSPPQIRRQSQAVVIISLRYPITSL